MKYFDIHSHLNLSPLSERKDEIIKTLVEKEVGTIIVGVDYETSAKAVEIASESENLFACVGLHPTEAGQEIFEKELFRDLANNERVIAIGECGLDYFRISPDDIKTKDIQKEVFNSQIDLAIEKNLPLILHIRPQKGTMDAYEEALEILEKKMCEVEPRTETQSLNGDVHFFVGSVDIANRFLELGFHLSFTGVITFTHDYDEVIKILPIERILAETDAPFVTPAPYRGQTCEPWMVEEVVRCVAKIKDLDEEQVRIQILQNVKNLFGIKI